MINKTNSWRCNSCRNSCTKGKSYYCCECDYDICEICIKKTLNTEKNHGHPHKLILFELQALGWTCDNCKVHGDCYKTRYRCQECDFDLCLDCHYGI